MPTTSSKRMARIARSKIRELLVLGLIGSIFGPLHAQTWQPTPNSPYASMAVACSGDGRIFYALTSEVGNLYRSTNGGASWTQLLQLAGYPLSCSSDGTKIATGSHPWISTNSGASFLQGTIDGNIAAWSANGNMLVVVGEGVSITTNNGTTWSTPFKTGGLKCQALSANGAIIATASKASLYISTNSGQYWSNADTGSNTGWLSLACTADGKNIVATGDTGTIVSHDTGKTWKLTSTPTIFFTINSSADGSLLVANDFYIYISRDFGASWLFDNTPGFPDAVTCSADGTLLLAASSGSVVTETLPPPLSIVPSASQLTLSWPAPSTQYTLQQASDLPDTNWLSVTNAITVTNYRNQVILAPPATGNAFYRLHGPTP